MIPGVVRCSSVVPRPAEVSSNRGKRKEKNERNKEQDPHTPVYTTRTGVAKIEAKKKKGRG